MLPGWTRWPLRAASWFAVVVVASATTIGIISRHLGDDDAPYFLLTDRVAAHPVASVLIFLAVLAAYAVGFHHLCRWLDRWRNGVPTPTPTGGRRRQVAALTEWVFSRWYRVSLALLVVWMPLYLTSFPGQPNPDFARMLGEFLLDRSDFTGNVTAPWEAYPTSNYLMTEGEGMWSNHHNFFLMLYYGSVSWVSIQLFNSVMPAIFFLSLVSLAFTLVAFGRALGIVGEFVTSWKVRLTAFLVITFTPLIAWWSMSQTKNHIFAAALVWWLALLVRYVHAEEPVRRRWYIEASVVSLILAASVLFGWILLLAQAAAMLFLQRRRVAAVAALAVPALLVHGVVAAAVYTGAIIPSDPIETKGLQLQQLALTLREHPDALTPTETAELSKIFDLEAMAAAYNPDLSDPVKSSGPLERKTKSYKYKTVQPEDWDVFNKIWLDVSARHPDTFTDALVQKSYRYLDPIDEGTNWYPPWSHRYERTVGDHSIAPVHFNRPPRTAIRGLSYACYESMPCRLYLSHAVKTVLVVLICAAGIAVGRRFALFWSVPFVLQIGILVMSPLAAGGRYALGFTYALGLVLMIMAIDDRRGLRRAPDDGTPIGSPGS